MEKRCKRKVLRDKYERNAPEIRNWWYQLFDTLEFDASIPPEKKLSILSEIFPANILKRIMSIMTLQEEKYKGGPSEESGELLDLTAIPKVRFENDASLNTGRSMFDYKELSLNAKDLGSSLSPPSDGLKKDTTPHIPEKVIPYMNFFKRRPDRAAIWRALPPLLLEEMNLLQKAAAITEAIATDFVSWIKTLAGEEESTLSVNSIVEMFEIAMQINSATSLCVKLSEMPSVPQQVANAMNLPDMSTRETLYNEIMRDHRASRRKCKIVAFGRRLPTDMQVKPLKENVKKKWLSCEKVPPKLETMAAVWQGITHLKTSIYPYSSKMTTSEAIESARDSKELENEKEPSIGSSKSTLVTELYENDKDPDGFLVNNTKDTNTVASTDTQKVIFTIDKGEEQDQFQENKKLNKVPSTPSFCSECNNEVYLRPHNLYKNRVLSTVVTSNRSSLPPRKTVSTGDLRGPASVKNKNENMVLQLVLPSGSQNSNHENNNYLTATSIDDILGNGHLKERNGSRPHSVHSQQDFYSSLGNGDYINRTYSASNLSEYGHQGLGAHSIPPTPALPSEPDRPTPPDEKKKAFQGLLTNVLSVFYAIFNITLGLAVYVSDIVDGTNQIAEIFSLLLVIVAFMYILYLTIDISYHMRKKHKYDKLLEKNTPETIEMKERADGNFEFNITLPEVVTLKKSLEHHYCFKKDRHSTNFYLKVGAAGFCFGHLIHSGLLLGYQIVFLTSEETEFYECASVATLVLDVIYPIYSFLLLFFMFKYSNVIINRNTVVARFGIMHCLSSSLCFWVWTIFRETVEALANKDDYNTTTTTGSPEDFVTLDDYSQPYALPLTSFNKKGAQILTEYVSASTRRFTVICEHDDQSLSTIYTLYSPYLYPFSVEYSILVVGVLYLVWQNIGMCKEEDDEEASTRQCKTPSGSNDNMESNVVIHADCHSSNKGLFGGFMVLVLTITSTILFFIAIYTDGGSQGELGVTVNIVTSLIILTSMTFACVLAYRQITKLDLNSAHHNLLDDVLLFICIPAYFLNGIFSIIPAIIYANVIGSINICLEVLQVLLQTCFILDGLRRSSNTKSLRQKKPGREMVTFLVICNVALWIMQTFEVKSHGMQDNRYDFYGKELWTILGHMCLPLMMFYRFHSSVCIGDIWKYAYEPSGH